MSRTPGFSTYLEFAHELADISAAAILPRFRRPLAVTNKAGKNSFDPVTAADRSAERAIRNAIKHRWPEHGLIGEEFGVVREGARLRWIVDPIDGTRAFIMGSPLWGTLIGLMDETQAVLGVMNQPFTGERFWSGPNAAYMRHSNGKPRRLKTRACAHLSEGILSTTHPDLFTQGAEADAFGRLRSKARMTRFGGDCYAYCLLAAGFVDVVAEAGLKSFDIMPLIPIIERAGGRVTGWDGGPAATGGRVFATGDRRLHDEALRALAI